MTDMNTTPVALSLSAHMMTMPLTISSLLVHAARHSGDTEIVSKRVEGDLRLAASIPAEICGRPQQTVSQSEAGFEKIMQCVELSFQWTLPGDQSTLQLQLTIHKSPP